VILAWVCRLLISTDTSLSSNGSSFWKWRPPPFASTKITARLGSSRRCRPSCSSSSHPMMVNIIRASQKFNKIQIVCVLCWACFAR
jgi:hypothetical protein